jgi:hypothetical protein
MKKAEMIKKIQLFEAKAFLRLKSNEQLFGGDDVFTSKSRSAWVEIENLMTELEIKSDLKLPEHQEALEIIRSKYISEINN